MFSPQVSSAEGPAAVTGPSGCTDLNALLAALLAGTVAHLRCEPLPPAIGSEEEWWLLLCWLLQPIRNATGNDPRYVHIQCSEVTKSREQRYQLIVRCSGLNTLERPFQFSNRQLAGIADRLGLQLQPCDPSDAHCLFILHFAGKKITHAHQ